MGKEDSLQQKKKNEAHLSQLASVGQIAAGIAHEVKNPLTAVKGFLQLLKEKNEERYITIAEAELNNALAILQNLLQVSKPDMDEEPFERLDLTVELNSVIQLFQDQFYRVTVIKNLENPGTYINGKKNQLKRAFFNLLKNAFEAIEGKGTIVIGHEASEDTVTVTIQDSGSGIPKEKLNLLGTPFYTTKQNGTGMGLTFVFSVIYQNNGFIEVESEEESGTVFKISFARDNGSAETKEKPRLTLQKTTELKDFFTVNRDKFEEQLLLEAVNVRDKIDEIMGIGNINLLENAHKLVLYVVEGREHEVVHFAKTEGIMWAKHSLTLAFKLEWIQAVRRVMWDFLFHFNRGKEELQAKEHFFALEKRINELIDQFLNHLFMSYSQFKDDLIRTQREMVEDLSVPIIPLTQHTSILPLIGPIDATRSITIEEKVINEIGANRIKTLIIDLSGAVHMAPEVIHKLMNVIDGVKMMGCEVIITGLRAEVVRLIIGLGLTFENKAITKGTLQQALEDHLS
ncbi:ATP-binding protein [Paenibacillus arenilitoris]|uniref:histidine kinase n=1 Tax=Paenibacillus arenilitoris TaxID=2772299 RepID=A0A927CMI2_9BACL|nr:ATP-binding protein [Paenibacillus arenilitoris]MBD2870823.1 STAS domain-containing protein [Paenibacillus arenilitoris]